MANFDTAFPIIMRHEGGYVNNKLDPGGPTNHGVTQRMWEKWVGRTVTMEEMQALTIEQVKPFYKKEFWDVLKLDAEEAQDKANALIDFFINVRPKTFREVITAAAPITLDSLFREKMRHYFEECRRRRKEMTPAEADQFLLNWGERALEMTS